MPHSARSVSQQFAHLADKEVWAVAHGVAVGQIGAWLRFLGSHPGAIRDAISQALVANHVRLFDPNLESEDGLGVVVFTTVNEDLFDFLARTTDRGLRRVLAVAAPPSKLTPQAAWRLIQAGAADVLAWDGRPDPAAEIAARLSRWDVVDRLMRSPLVTNNLVGSSRRWTAVLRQIVEAARFTDASIVILGESGTGKDLAARLIHTLDQRPRKGDLVVLDCTTIVPELAGSEFFGHERGAFTGAVATRDGAFGLADGGTLFLDEVGELPRALQGQLLRVVQEHTYKRVGGNVWNRTNFRLLCATNRDLREEVRSGAFRADLFYRIADWTVQLPPLRDRTEDVPLLARYFMTQFGAAAPLPELDPAVRDYLLARDYPGNVRDLKQVVGRMLRRHAGTGPVTVGDVAPEDRPSLQVAADKWTDGDFERAIRRAFLQGAGLRDIRHAAEQTAIHIAMESGSLQHAARRLGVSDRALQMRRANQRLLGEPAGLVTASLAPAPNPVVTEA